MLIPRFSIRTSMLMTAIFAVLCLVFGLAYREHLWAQRVTVGLICFAFVMFVHGAFFLAVWCFSKLPKGKPAAESAGQGGTTA